MFTYGADVAMRYGFCFHVCLLSSVVLIGVMWACVIRLRSANMHGGPQRCLRYNGKLGSWNFMTSLLYQYREEHGARWCDSAVAQVEILLFRGLQLGNCNYAAECVHGIQARWMSVTMLLCFMGATLGWSISWQLFIDAVLLAYLSGASAQQLYDQLLPKEFSQAGEIFRAVSSASVAAEKINAEAFARCACLSTPSPEHGNNMGVCMRCMGSCYLRASIGV